MSNSLAIAAVTSAVRNLLDKRINAGAGVDATSDPGLAGTVVTTRPPDEAKLRNDAKQLNLFLYQTTLDAAYRNQGPGEPPLPLVLHYLVTPYVRDDQEDSAFLAHRLLGRAMSILHDHPVLGAPELKAALPGSDLHEQVERIRIVPQSLSLEDLSKVWTAIQASYRTSAIYQMSVVLIDTSRKAPAAPPVLKRGAGDRGAAAIPSPSPYLSEARPPDPQPSVRLGETLTLSGQSLSGEGLSARVEGRLVASPILLAAAAGTLPETLSVVIPGPAADPDALTRWAAGIYTLSLAVQRPPLPTWTTNDVPFALAPSITVSPKAAAPGDLTLTVTAVPRIRDGQKLALLFGDRQVAPKAIDNPGDTSKPTTLTFDVSGVAAGTYLVRLRVDGVDSLPIVRKPGPPAALEFDADQQVAVA